MSITTYSELQTAIISFAMRDGDTDFTARVPDFIRLLEERVNNTLNVRQMETTVSLTPDGSYDCTLPSDYQGFRSLRVTYSGFNRPLELTTKDQADTLYPSGDTTNVPAYFYIVGSKLHVVPNYSGTVELTYWAQIPSLSNSNPTNWLLTQAPSIYLYGSLVEAGPFIQDDAMTATWAKMYQTAVDNLNASDRDQRFSRVVSRIRLRGNLP